MAISGFVLAAWNSAGTPARRILSGSAIQLSGRNSRSPTIDGTSPRARVSDTRVWQLACLPSAEAYCGATPTEALPFFGSAVSSTTSTASSLLSSPSALRANSSSSGAVSQLPAETK